MTGTVVELRPDHKRRVRASLGGDFTPFRIPVVRFSGLLLPDGTTLPIADGRCDGWDGDLSGGVAGTGAWRVGWAGDPFGVDGAAG